MADLDETSSDENSQRDEDDKTSNDAEGEDVESEQGVEGLAKGDEDDIDVIDDNTFMVLNEVNSEKMIKRLGATSAFSAEESRAVLDALYETKMIARGDEVQVWNFFELFMGAIISIKQEAHLPVTRENARSHFEHLNHLTTEVEKHNPFISLGSTFANIGFKKEMLIEIADNQRLRTGPATSVGLYPCPKCHAPKEKTTAIQRQLRSSDEPLTLISTCGVCGKRF